MDARRPHPPKVPRAGRFVVNILSDEQIKISNQFAQQGTDEWHEVEWQESPLGNPIIAGSLYWLDCEIYAEHAAGDHLIAIGEVKALNLQEAASTAFPQLDGSPLPASIGMAQGSLGG
ncbi:flavin reductase family protein [Achromobacter sp.]|uniref:flavin reductase family protein n=1 Tax=Achromobacter sp. TaxID=134375 RepID=UPI002F95E695